jgi:hypothetical protein
MTINWKGSGHDQIKVLSWHLPEKTIKKHEKPVTIADVPAKIQTKHLLNASLVCYF